MTLNIVLHYSTVLKILTDSSTTDHDAFNQLKQHHHLWLPVCSLPYLQQNISQLDTLENLIADVNLLSQAGVDKNKLTTTSLHDDLIGLAAADLPGTTAIWTEQALTTDIPNGNQAFILDFIQQQTMTFPFIDLPTQQLTMRTEIERGIFNILQHGSYVMGPEISQFEQDLAHFIGSKHALACSSGTDALLMALLAYDVKPGDAIFTSPFTFVATAEVISLLGATPIFVDIDPQTYNLDPKQLSIAIEQAQQDKKYNLKGIIPVDLFGLPADYDPIMALAKQHNLFVVEDAAQGLAGVYHGRQAGALGHIGATSFFPAKPLGCYGDGGAVFTDNDALYEKLFSIRVHGQHNEDRYENVLIGLNARCDTFQAAILQPKLAVYREEINARQTVADTYTNQLNQVVVTPHIPQGLSSAWAQYSIQSEQRSQIQSALRENNIPSAVYYPKPLHLQTAFKDLAYQVGDFPVSEAISERIFSLPMNPYLEEQQLTQICDVIKAAS